MQIGGKYVSHKWEYHDLDQHHIKYIRYDDSDTITPVIKVDSLSSEELLQHRVDKGIKTQEGVEEDYLGYGKNNPTKTKFKMGTWKENNRKLYPIYEDHGSVWHDHFFNDLCTCDVFIPQPHPQIFYKPFIEHFNSCHNLVPYKIEMLDITIARINLFVSAATNKTFNVNVKNVEDAWYTNKELVFKHLDDFTRNNRNVEQTLIDNGIKYDYIDLDNHDYKILCDNELPRTQSTMPSLSSATYDKNTYRYKLASTMAKEYLQKRNLTDMRLSGRLQDNI
tara:strand:- start:217 stop:1053 length:837 start_codon:yes stop_codon:yes gene_type:complete